MFTWILIALAIAFIFGVIKIETVKELAKKYEPQARELFNKAKTTVEAKAAELQKNNAKQTSDAQPVVTENHEEPAKPAETTEHNEVQE